MRSDTNVPAIGVDGMPTLLHVHSWYSLLEGTAEPAALVRAALEGGYTALALTDTNNLYGVVSFVESAHRAGLRPFVGACLERGGQRAVVLVADPTGYRYLCHAISACDPRNDQQGDGSGATLQSVLLDLVATDGLHLMTANIELAEALQGRFPGRLWLEIVRPGDPRRERDLLAAAERLRLPIVASTAAYMMRADEYETHRLVCTVRRLSLRDRLPPLETRPEHRLVSVVEIRRRFHDLPQALRNADALADSLRSDVLPRQLVLPTPVRSRPLNLSEYLRALCERGLRERDLGGDLKARERLRRELQIIEANGLPGYFLTVRDITRAARRRGHTMALRGSAGNSLVCYLLGITEVDPLRFRLELERFLHPGRVDLPDIDLDFDWKARDEMIDYVIRRYGAAHVARISSHQFFQPRSAFRQAAKVHGLSTEQVSELLTTLDQRIDAMLLPEAGLTMPPLPRAFPLESSRWPRVIDDARRLLGRPAQLGLHPGGIVITPRPIVDYVPVQWAAKGVLMTQYEKDAVEAIGLVKIDLLGNRALSTVDEARHNARVVIPSPVQSAADSATVSLLRRADTLGITQLESPAMRHLLMQMQPTGLDDVIQALALLRPGAASIGMKELFVQRRRGQEATPLAHPMMELLLGETHGLMLYEDDALRVIQGMTGLPAPEADRFRKRIAKHQNGRESESLYREFVASCRARDPSNNDLDALWMQLAKFNRYSFCKSHSVSYGLIAWQAAYLKAHHPVAFWTAVLNNNQGAYPTRVYIEAVKRDRVTLLPPCINRSERTFSVQQGAIRVGLDAVAGVPELVRLALMEARRDGPFAGLTDLRRRVNIGPEALSALIRVGALDCTGRSRPALFLEAEIGVTREGELFTLDPTEGWTPPSAPADRQWRDEWQVLGFIVSRRLAEVLRPRMATSGPLLIGSGELRQHVGRLVRVAGIVATARQTHTETGRPVQFVTLEDEQGLAEVSLFDGTCPTIPYLNMGPYVATGVVEDRFGACALTARRFETA